MTKPMKIVMKVKGLTFESLAVGDFFLIEGEVLRKVRHGTAQDPESHQDVCFTAMHMPTGALVFIGSNTEILRVKGTLTVETA